MTSRPHSSASEPLRAAQLWSQRFVRWSFEVVAVFFLSLIILDYPDPPASDSAEASRQVEAFARDHDLAWGSEIVTIAGPLGVWLDPVVTPGLGKDHHRVQLGFSIFMAILVVVTSRRFAGAARGGVIVLVALVLSDQHLILIAVVMLAALWCVHRPARRGSVGIDLGVGAIFAVPAMLQWELLILSLIAMAMLGRQRWRQEKSWGAVVPLASCGLVLLGLWTGLGQSLAGLIHFVWNGWSLHQAQTLAGPGPESGVLAAGIIGLIGLALLLTAHRRNELSTNAALIWLPAGVALSLFWQYGLLRSSESADSFFAFLLGLLPLVILMLPAASRKLPVVHVAGAMVGGAGLVGWLLSDSDRASLALASANYRIHSSWDRLRDAGRWEGEYQHNWQHVLNQFTAPDIQALVADQSVDVIGHGAPLALFNGLNYQPRPWAISDWVITAPGNARNSEFLRSAEPPEYILQSLRTPNERLPALNDAQASLWVYQNYRLIAERQRMLIWKRDSESNAPVPELVHKGTAVWGESISLPSVEEGALWAEIDVRASWWGWFWHRLHRPSEIRLQTTDQTGFKAAHQFLPSAGKVGFLVSPMFLSNHDILDFHQNGNNDLSPTEIALIPATGEDAGDYRSKFSYRFFRLPPLPRNEAMEIGNAPEIFRTFSDLPERFEALYAFTPLPLGEAEVVTAHPPSFLEFRVPEDRRQLRAEFAYFENALAEGQNSDGVEFIAEAITDAGDRETIFYQILEPGRRQSDHQVQTLEVEIPPEASRVRLRTTPGSSHDISYDWVYWKDVTFADLTEESP